MLSRYLIPFFGLLFFNLLMRIVTFSKRGLWYHCINCLSLENKGYFKLSSIIHPSTWNDLRNEYHCTWIIGSWMIFRLLHKYINVLILAEKFYGSLFALQLLSAKSCYSSIFLLSDLLERSPNMFRQSLLIQLVMRRLKQYLYPMVRSIWEIKEPYIIYCKTDDWLNILWS